MAAPRIDDYAFLSDGHAPALVSRDGSVDWWCPPRADQPPVFGRLLDPDAGHWSVTAEQQLGVERRYAAHSLIVESTITTASGEAVVTDALAMEPGARGHELGRRSPHVLLRSVVGVRGRVTFRCEFSPRFEYGLTTPHLRHHDHGLVAEAGPVRLRLTAPISLEERDGSATATFSVDAGQRTSFAVAHATTHDDKPFADLDVADALAETQRTWTSWAEQHPGYDGLYADLARRSALVLQGLTYKPTGAVLAAATTSVPAAIGGDATWDYRYAWLRDLSLTSQSLWIAACPDEASEYLHFLADAAGNPSPGSRVQIMYAVDGQRQLPEHQLHHLRGFRDSKPVRVGNAAWDQAQLDVMGEVLDMAHRFADQLDPLDERTRRLLVWLTNEAAGAWKSPDAGMWEARDDQRQYLTSKVMCWVALDRAVELASLLGEDAQPDRWSAVRDEIRATVLERGWNDDVGAFTGAFGSDRLDASVLLLPLVGFLPADDDRMRATIHAVEQRLVRDGLVYRWDGDTNGFVLCTYWLVECLALAGDVDKARQLFDQLTARANDLGLFAEQIDPHTGEHTGNFPQAFSHVGLINAAYRLATLTDHQPKDSPDMAKLQDCVALITGSDSGIGQATAVAFAREGADVIVNYLHDEDGANHTKQQVEGHGRKAIVVQADHGHEDQVQRMFAAGLGAFGHIDILMNNASVDASGTYVADLDISDFERALRSNLIGQVICCKHFINHRKAAGGGGRIINTTSVHQEQPRAGAADYDCSKGALRNLTRTLRNLSIGGCRVSSRIGWLAC